LTFSVVVVTSGGAGTTSVVVVVGGCWALSLHGTTAAINATTAVAAMSDFNTVPPLFVTTFSPR